MKGIKDNKSDIESVVKTIGSIGGVAVDACKLAGEAFDGLGINMKNAGAVANFIKAEIKDCRETLADMKETLGDTALADGISRLWNWAMADYMPKDAEKPEEQEAKKSDASQSAEETRRKVEEAMAKAKKASSGGGTVAKFMAQRNIDTLDAGVPVLSMHAPYETVAKLDCYMTYKCMKTIFEQA